MTSRIVYKGDLRTECTHLNSAAKVITDAPLDNHGKGQGFSPTDIVATSLGSCMLTVMGIKAEKMGIDMKGSSISIKKIMGENPRRILRIEASVILSFSTSEKNKNILEKIAINCPVKKSLNSEMEIKETFLWPEII
ncbi:MAG: OsmC family protein [Bacteroidota bacterium]|nr:OsmC family protein [Bacteroidota bacterium]